MKNVSIREVRALLADIENVVADEGELVVTRHGRPVARILPMESRSPFRSHADLRARMPYQEVPSERLIREDRDER